MDSVQEGVPSLQFPNGAVPPGPSPMPEPPRGFGQGTPEAESSFAADTSAVQTASGTARSSKRSTRACYRCSQKKIRCNGAGPPCGPCVTFGYADACSFNPNPKKRGPPKGYWSSKKRKDNGDPAGVSDSDTSFVRSGDGAAPLAPNEWENEPQRGQYAEHVAAESVSPLPPPPPPSASIGASPSGANPFGSGPSQGGGPSAGASGVSSYRGQGTQGYVESLRSHSRNQTVGDVSASSHLGDESTAGPHRSSSLRASRSVSYQGSSPARGLAGAPTTQDPRFPPYPPLPMPIQGDTSSSFMPGSGSALSNINFTHSPGYGAGPPPPPTYNSPYSAVGPGDPSAGGNDAGEPDAVEGRLIDIYAAFVHIHWPILAVNKTAAVPPSGNSNAGTSQQAGGHDSTRNSQSLIGYISGLKRTNPILFDAVCAVSGALFESDMDLKQGGFGSGMILPGLQQHSAPSPGAGGSNPDADDVTAAELSRRYAERCRALILPLAHERKLWVVQSLLLIALVDCGAGRMNQAFQLGGMACRLALDMNLHRAESERKAMVGGDEDASDASEGAVTIEDRIMLRRRVFWACYILDKILSAITEKPVMLRAAEVDVPFPSTASLDETELWLSTARATFVQHSAIPQLKQVRSYTVSSFVAWAKLMVVLEYILEELYSPAARRSASLAATGLTAGNVGARTMDGRDAGDTMEMKFRNILKMLNEWSEDLPREIRWYGLFSGYQHVPSSSQNRNRPGLAPPSGAASHRGLPPHVLTLRAWAALCMLALHRPFIPHKLAPATMAATGSFAPSLSKPAQACIAAAREIVTLTDAYETTFPLRKIPSGWVFLIFQAGTIFSSFSQFQPLAQYIVQHAQQQGQQAQAAAAEQHAQEVAHECQQLLNRCIERLSKIAVTHRGASRHVEILRGLSEKTSASGDLVDYSLPSGGDANGAGNGSQGGGFGGRVGSAYQQHPWQQLDGRGGRPDASASVGYDGMSERLILEGFWNSMPFGESWDDWTTYFRNHLQVPPRAPTNVPSFQA